MANVVYKIKLIQFEDYRNCSWIRGLISLSTDFFKKTKVINGSLFLEGGNDKRLTMLCEASSVDFKYDTLNCTINDIEMLLNSLNKKNV
jgi:hypothetical protein